MSTFATRLQNLIKSTGTTQIQLSRATGISQPTLSRYKKEPNKEPTATTAAKVARFFNCDLIWLITGEPTSESFATRLRGVMATKNLAQVDVATMTGVTQSQVSNWLTGKTKPQPRSLRDLASALKVEPKWLLNGNSEAAPISPMPESSALTTLADLATQTEA